MTGRHIPPHLRDAWSARNRDALSRQVALAAAPPIAAIEAIEAIVFDAYGTLLDPASVEVACRPFLLEPAPFVARWRAKQLEYSWHRALMGRYADFAIVTAEALAWTLAQADLTTADDATARALRDAWLALDPFPEVPAALERLHDRPLAILSNGSPAMLATGLAHAGLTGTFTAVISADAARTYKPDPQVYALATAALALPADRLLFVSANAWDAAGAKSCGFRVAWCNRAGQPAEHHDLAPDITVRDLGELADVFGR